MATGTFLDVVRDRIGGDDRPAFTFLQSDGSNCLSFRELGIRARRLAGHVQCATKPGDRVLIALPPGESYVLAFFAAVLSGTVAVPVPAPASAKALPRLELIARDAGAALVLTDAELDDRIAGHGGPLAAVQRLCVDGILTDIDWVCPSVTPKDLLFLQYTSGSTGDPKGVMITHANAMANLTFCQSAFRLTRSDVVVSWLPPHHDFGLVGGILSTVFTGAHAVHLTPLTFLKRPLRWLQAVHDFRATVTGAPNFAWDLCTRKIAAEERSGLDLSSLRIAINGAERVQAATLDAFATTFADCGFDAGAFAPAYGLAEATLLVSALTDRQSGTLPATAEARRGAENTLTHHGALVSNGIAPDVAIVGPDGMPVTEGDTGEIWVRGASVAAGYWNNPAASAQVFGLSSGTETGYMRTGDLGFLDAGALYVSGRSRELITLAGRNIFPQDIEPDVEALRPQFRAAGCAVIAQDREGQTQIAILQEVLGRRDLNTDGLIESLRAMLLEKHEIAELGAVILLRTGDLPRTTSGKIQRYRCAELLATGAFSPVWSWEGTAQTVQSDFAAPRTPVEYALGALWAELLDMEQVSINDNFMELSGNSLLATQVISALHKRFGVDVSLRGLFENPTIAQLATEIERKLAEQRDQYEARTAGEVAMPISDQQKRAFYLDQFAPGDPIYTRRRMLALEGEVQFDALSRAATELSRRHEVLRYRFAVAKGVPTAALMPLREMDVQRAAASDAADAVARAQDIADAPFDLMQGALMRIGVVSQDEDTHLLVLAMHAIVADRAAVDLALNELAALYSAYAEGLASPLPVPAMQHADHVRWQEGWLRGSLLAGQRDWWRTQLADAPAALALPVDHPRPAVQSHRGARHAWFMRQVDAPSADDMGAAFAVLLHRFSGQEDIAIGTELTQRSRDGIAGLVAPMENLAVLRVAVSPGMSLATVRDGFRRALDGAMAHGDIPFDQVVEAVAPEHRLDRSPLFQVLLRIEQDAENPPDFHRMQVADHAPSLVRSEFDMTLRLRKVEGGIAAEIDYAADLFDPTAIARMAAAYGRILSAMAEPAQDVLATPLIDRTQADVILRDWNATQVRFDALAPIAQMFEAQVRARPDSDCVIYGDATLSFDALNRRANRLAHGLRARGIGPDSIVGLHVERSFEMMVALVAILKAGGAYLPLDPALPAERLAFMADDAAAQVVLTTDDRCASLPPLDCPTLRLDGEAHSLPQDETNPQPRAELSNLAYVIYTSGSTGRPKGVAVPQGGVANRLLWMTQAYGVAANERVMQKTPYSFDVSVWELFWPLISGATLVMAKPGGHQDVAYLAKLIRDARITTMHFVPPMLESFLSLADLSGLQSLRQVLCSGQALPVDLQTRFQAALPNVTLRNLYGPTEASIEVSAWDCRPHPGQASVPIGHPIANTQLYILDAAMNPVPPGVAGELMLAGAGLARGYLNRPDLTAAAFVPDPFGAPGARMYRSGDLARFLPTGAIEYLGRIDDQVKIRGFRIELGEIEARLRDCTGVRNVLVVARDDIAGDTRLVAYVVGAEAKEGALRAALLETLPDYMVPAHFVWLEVLPVTPNGKIDRKALPLPDMRRAGEGYVAPNGATEETLAEIWAGLLGLERVGATDSFFALGGHSLLATQAISKLRERFGVDVSLRAILFDQPTIASLALLIDGQVGRSASTSMTAIPATERIGPQPLSFSQKRLWFLDQMEPGNPFYNIPAPTRLLGALNSEAMGRALNEIIRRHGSLRTRFATQDGTPVQIVEPAFTLDIPTIDLGHLPPAEREAEARKLAVVDAQTPFDLEQGPPLRATLLRLSGSEHVILFNMHHIISDGWSMGVLVTEFAAIYRAYAQGTDHDLPPLAIQYVDFAEWQRGWLQGETLQRQLSYWANALRDAPPVLSLPTDRPRPAAQSYRGATHDLTISDDLVAELYALGARHQSTLYMVLLSAFDVLLARYARERDICVGTYIANRNRAEVESLIGFFVNMLVLRSDVDPEANFEDLLREVRHTALEAYANQDLPFEYLVDHLKPERTLGHSPLFQVVFVLQNTPMDDLDASGLVTEPLAVNSHVSKFDLTLRLTEKNGALVGCFEYATDLFDAATIAGMAEQFTHLLGEIVRKPQRPLGDLSLLDAAQTAKLAAVSDGRGLATRKPLGLLEGFVTQVARDPGHPAVDGVSYGALDARATALAHLLAANGVTRGDVVGLWLGRGANFVTAMLAVAKVGAVWLPLDPAAPGARRDFILSDAAPVLILSETAIDLPEALGPVILIDDHPSAPPCTLPGVTSGDAAYILYTSGTTGQPKGVVVCHGAVANHAQHHIKMCGLSPQDRVLNFAATGFDTCIEEIIPSLMAGATIVSRPEGFVDTGTEFDAFLTENRITLADLPTQFWHQWIGGTVGVPDSLRTVILGGEALTAAQVTDWSARADTANIRLINTYGPTEATIIATATDVTHAKTAVDPPLGQAIDGVMVRLLDHAWAPVPPGVPGEIYLGGECLALGYLNRPDLTAERFVPDPFGPPGSRLYRTGDIGRLRADGTLQYLGRTDDQIKLRGVRIEPAEVEAALRSAGAMAAHVMPREDAPGDRRLVAYATGDLEAETLMAALRALLPPLLMPQHIVLLDHLPMTSNGKIDRRALPAPEHKQATAGPRGRTAQTLSEIWGAVLNLAPGTIADDDNFFALGGHSLLATQVVSKIRTGFAIKLPLRALFEHPTIGGLAPVIDDIMGRSGTRMPGSITPLPRDGALPLSFAQQRLWFLDQLDPGNAFYNIPIALQLNGPLDADALRRAFDAIIDRHEVLRSRIRSCEHRPEVIIDPPATFVLPFEDLTHLDAHDAAIAAEQIKVQAARAPFDLAQDRLLRARLIRTGPHAHTLVVVMHHIVADGWSMGVLVREMAALYAAFLRGAPSPLAPLPFQYADFAAWQRDQLRRPEMQRQLDHWTDRLADAPAVLDLPTDRPRPTVQSYRGDALDISLPAPLVAALRQQALARGATLFMILQSAFALLMHRLSGQEDILVGTPVAGRNRSDIEGHVGFFVNTLVLRSRIDLDMPFTALLDQTREETLAAFDHQDVPFEHLVEALAPDRDLGHAPVFQVMFVLQNAPVDPVALERLTVAEAPMPVTGAKFDLTCSLQESDAGVQGQLEFATDLFDAGSARRIIAHFRCLLEDIAARPTARVGALRMIEAEAESRLVGGMACGPLGPPAEDVVALFEAAVDSASRAPAVSHGDTVWDYATLNARANALARELTARGVGPETIVGISASATPVTIAALIAILKTGAAYLPLDPAHPRARLDDMLENAAPALVLTDAAPSDAFRDCRVPLLRLDTLQTDHNCPNPVLSVPPAAAGYVIFTSGSTGRPKGVVLPRSTLNTLIAWQIETAPTPEAVLQFASLNFDVSFQEIFSTLCAGKRLVLIPASMKRDLAALREYTVAQGVGRMFLPNAVLQQWLLLPESDARALPCEIISAGEALLTANRRDALERLLGGATLFNQYGPTETHVVTQMVLPAASAGTWDDRPAIGRPIRNVRAYVLDAGLTPVAPGVWGDLFIGGTAPARGYHRRPDLTAEAFLPDPFHGSGTRMYRTGDIVRWRTDGMLEYRGRRDDQVKLRGIRVEPGEVAAALRDLPQVADAAVILRQDPPGDARLVGYVVPRDPTEDADLLALLATRLPSYMVPSSIVVLDRLPLTANGKLDRRALPVPVAMARGGRPEGAVAVRVAEIWAEVLGLPVTAVGLDDTFFALGGHSLLATQVISRLRAAFGVELPLRALFEQPTLAGLAPVIEAAMAAGEGVAEGPVARHDSGPAPLSFAQQRLWFLDQLAPGDTAYALPMALRLEGPLDAAALRAALNGVVARHAALRTRFALQDGAPMQIVDPAPRPLELPLHDLSDHATQDRALAQALEAEAAQPFDLATGPLLRAALYRLGPEQHVVSLNLHHIVSDGWSMGVLLREMTALYEAHLAGADAALPPLPVQYADYARWQRDTLKGALLERQLAFWQRRLAGLPGLLALPTDRPRAPQQSHRGAALGLRLDAGLTAGLERLAQRRGATLHMVLTGVLSVLLARWSGQDDIAVGTPVAGRRHAALEGLIGFFVNTLVLRTHVDGDEAFGDLLERVRDDALAGLAHQDLPFEQLVEAISPARDLSHAPLFQVMLALQNAPLGEMGFGGLHLSPLALGTQRSKFDLTLSFHPDPEAGPDATPQRAAGLSGTLEYATDLFDAATMARFAEQFVHLARAVVRDPGCATAALPLMDATAQAQTVAAWAARPAPAPQADTLDRLFAAAAARHPDNIALRFEGQSTRYAALDAQANRLAHALIAQGAGPERLIGICTERGPGMILAILAVLKTGAAYLPLDPDHPDDRLAWMLADAAPTLVLADPAQHDRLAQITDLPLLAPHAPPEQPDTPPTPTATPDTLAYVIYTSGSTGRPKGVMVAHRAIVNRVVWLDGAFEITAEDRIIQKTPYGFDVSVGEIFLPLIAGATLIIARPAGHVDVTYMSGLIRDERASIVHFVAPLMESSLAVADAADFASLRFVMCSGQALPRAAQDRFMALFPNIALHNLYGPTEAAVEVTHWRCDAADPRTGPGVPIGRAIDNVSIYILDDALNPVPQGVPGHLYIGGMALARGYLNRPDLTAEAFVPDPFGSPGARMYRSGDRARYLPNGAVDYLGRSDDQIKVRGVRIEPGEIEAAILKCGYREAAVVAAPDASGELGVLAYIVAPHLDEADLREALSARIPDHMMPSAFMAIPALPLTPNGKLDRKALPKFDFTTTTTFIAPRSETEARIAEIWAEVLGRDDIGVADNFFKLGGQSLKAVTALNRMRETFGVEIGLEKAFALQTVETFARHIDALQGTSQPRQDAARKPLRI